MAHGPMDALKFQRKLVNYWRSSYGAGFVMALAEVAVRRNVPEQCPIDFIQLTDLTSAQEPEDVLEAKGNDLAGRLANRVSIGSAYWTHRDMVQLTFTASLNRPPQAIRWGDLPRPNGTTLFDRPAYFDMGGKGVEYKVNINGFTWWQSQNNGRAGVDVIMYSDRGDQNDTMLMGLRKHHTYSPWRHAPEALPVAAFFIPFDIDHSDDPFVAFVATWWHLIQQPISASTEERAPRPMLNALSKLKLADSVSVITLRPRKSTREPKDAPESGGRDWSHRWLVSGHPRWQWYPSESTHKLIFIHEYEKGPEDKPLVIRERVYSWSR